MFYHFPDLIHNRAGNVSDLNGDVDLGFECQYSFLLSAGTIFIIFCSQIIARKKRKLKLKTSNHNWYKV